MNSADSSPGTATSACRARLCTSARPAGPVSTVTRPTRPGDQPQPGRVITASVPSEPASSDRIVVAGVVLGQPGQVGHDRAVGQHRLDAAQLGAHRPVAQHPQPARVAGDRPADGGAVPARDADAQVQAGWASATRAQGDPGPAVTWAASRSTGPSRVQPGQAEHDLATVRHTPADQAGVPALRHHRHPGPGAQRQHRGDLVGVPGPQHGRGLAAGTGRSSRYRTRPPRPRSARARPRPPRPATAAARRSSPRRQPGP